MRIVRILFSLALVGVVMGGAQKASAAVASWAEEMDALPGPQWGLHDDFQDPTFKNNIELDDLDGNGGTGIWKHPLINYNLRPQFNTSSQGMVLVAGNDNPINALPSMAGPAKAQYTAEIRYKIITPLPEGSVGNGNDSFWFNVGGGNGSANSGADTRNFEGKGYGFQSLCGEGFLGCDPGNAVQPFVGTSREEWHTMRVIQDEVAETQRIYIDNTLMQTHDTSGYDRAVGFTRGLSFGFFNHPDGSSPYPEVHYDYIRLANGVVELGEPINPVPEPAAGLLAMVVTGLGLAARRRA